MERAKLTDPIPGVQFISSGSTLIDLILNGGWGLGRVFNIVGDKSVGKTGLAVEAFANFHIIYPKGRMRYAEAEAAFDESFAQLLGFPDNVERPDQMLHTVEDFEADFYKFVKKGGPGLYILDSLDALSDDAEIKKFEVNLKKRDKEVEADEEDGDEKIKGSYGTAKAKRMSELFRLLVQMAEEANCSLGIISQVRDNIGVRFGETKTRSGGRALDFYASQVLWLSELKKIDSKSIHGLLRPIGIEIVAYCKKNKLGFPFRKAGVDLTFAYGIDNQMSNLKWLKAIKVISDQEFKQHKDAINKARENVDYETLAKLDKGLADLVIKEWKEIEASAAPKVQKYRQVEVNVQAQKA